jgi:hypothetical protein
MPPKQCKISKQELESVKEEYLLFKSECRRERKCLFVELCKKFFVLDKDWSGKITVRRLEDGSDPVWYTKLFGYATISLRKKEAIFFKKRLLRICRVVYALHYGEDPRFLWFKNKNKEDVRPENMFAVKRTSKKTCGEGEAENGKQ